MRRISRTRATRPPHRLPLLQERLHALVRTLGGQGPNCDISEGFGRWRMPHDAELMELVTTVNIAAGFHAGDPTIIRATVDKALGEGLDMGVHVALPDLLGFGRRTMSVTPAEVRDHGVALVTEGFPELHYADDGQLVLERDKTPWEPDTVARRAVEMARGAGVTSLSGTHLDLDVRTLCVHSDAPDVLEVTRAVLAALDRAGIEVAALSRQ